jgi:hypothetical protein
MQHFSNNTSFRLPLSWEILAKFNFNISKSTCTDLRSAPSKFIWTNESHLKFQEALISTEIQHKIDSFIENDCGNSEIDINQKAEDLNDFFYLLQSCL